MCNHYCYLTVSGTKVFVMPGGMMKSNGNLVELIEKVKPEIRTLIEKCNTVSAHNLKWWWMVVQRWIQPQTFCCVLAQVKMWVQLLIPRIEDGNNFGVSIQEETVAELRTVEGEAASYLDQISRFESLDLCTCLFCFLHLKKSTLLRLLIISSFSLLDITLHGQNLFRK